MKYCAKPKKHLVYFLQNRKKSYIGYTVNLKRRFRQHTGVIKGGAKCTSRWKCHKDTKVLAYFSGFPNNKMALSFEWHAKRRRRARPFSVTSCHARIARFVQPLLLEKFKTTRPSLTLHLHPEVASDDRSRIKKFCARFQVPVAQSELFLKN